MGLVLQGWLHHPRTMIIMAEVEEDLIVVATVLQVAVGKGIMVVRQAGVVVVTVVVLMIVDRLVVREDMDREVVLQDNLLRLQ